MSMDLNAFTFRQIDADSKIKSFDCGDADLNDFLLSEAVNYYKAMMALTYILEDKSSSGVVAYFSLLNDKIVFNPEDKAKWNNLNRKVANKKRRKEYPAVKIGRLAIARDFAGQHIGHELLLLIKHMFSVMRRSACRFLTVDAYSAAVPFYEKCGFKFLSDNDKGAKTRAMYYDLISFPKEAR